MNNAVLDFTNLNANNDTSIEELAWLGHRITQNANGSHNNASASHEGKSVTVTHVMGRTTITAALGPLLAPPPQELTVGDGPFGLPLMPDMTVAFKADKMVIYDSPRPLREVIAFYHERFGRVQGMMVVQDETMGYPRLVLMANSAPTAFRMLTVDQDPTRPGHAKISLFGR